MRRPPPRLPRGQLGVLAALVTGVLLLAACSHDASDHDRPVSPTEGAHANGDSQADPAATIRRSTLELQYTLDAVTAQGSQIALVPSSQFVFTPSGTASGQPVRAGQRIGRLAITDVVQDSLTAGQDPSGANASALASLQAQEGPVVAPVSGTLLLSDDGAAIRAGGMDVTAALTPIQYLRFLSMPFSGSVQVETLTGPRKVGCLALWSVPVKEASPDAAATLHCRLGAEVETAAAMRATVTISATPQKNVLVAPNLFIGYDTKADQYYVLVGDGSQPRRVPVQVGVTDGVARVIRGEVEEGQQLVLPPVEGSPNGSGP